MTIEQKQFRHHPDGWIYIGDILPNYNQSMYPLAWFLTQEPGYSLTEGMKARIYTQRAMGGTRIEYQNYSDLPEIGDESKIYVVLSQSYQGINCEYVWKNNRYTQINSFHEIYDSINMYPAPEGLPYGAGDLYISKKVIYDAAYSEYTNQPPTLEEAKTIKINSLLTKWEDVRAGGVIYNGNTYQSNQINFTRLNTDWLNTLRGISLPGSYYVNDINLNEISFTQMDLENLLCKIQKLHYLCNLNFDSHRANILALLTVEAVEAYIIDTGWEVTPYDE